MIYVFVKDKNSINTDILSTFFDEKYVPEDQKMNAVQVESLPEPQHIEGKMAVLKYNGVENLFYYEYVDRPPTPEDELATIRNENAELLFRSASMEMEMASIRDENAELMFRLANLEMGGMM